MKQNYEDKSWSFLVARPSLDDPMFSDSVVLLLEDGEDSSLGVMLNKPTGDILADIAEEYEKFEELSQVEVYTGGPVNKDKITLAVWYNSGNTLGHFGFGLKPEVAEKILVENPDAEAAAFAGYSSWTQGQLNSEIGEETWFVMPVDIDLLDSTPSEDLWRELVMKAQPLFRKFPYSNRRESSN